MRTYLAMMLTALAALTARGYSYNGLTWQDGYTVGGWGCSFNAAKAYAKANNIPLITVWANPGCGYCKRLEEALATSSAKSWVKSRSYIFIFALGTADSPAYGMVGSDCSAAKSFARHSSGEFPYVGVWWPKGPNGREAKLTFSGRSGKMPIKTGTLAKQFQDSVDAFFGTPTIAVTPAAEYARGEPIKPIPIAVSGAPAAKLTATGLPAGIVLQDGTLAGEPRKSGFFVAKVTVTAINGATATAEVPFVVRTEGERIVRATCDAGCGKVTGSGVYADGKKVTLKATAQSGWVFTGWETGKGERLTGQPSYALVVDGEDLDFKATFVTVAADRASIALALDEVKLPLDRAVTNVVRQGVQVAWPIASQACSQTTVTASGLPPGLKLQKTLVDKTEKLYDYAIVGTPTTASKTEAKTGLVKPTAMKLKVTTAGRNSATAAVDVIVEPLPAWAYGTFSGWAMGTDPGDLAAASLTITAAGKLSGKFTQGGTNWTVAVTGYSQFAATGASFAAEAKASRVVRPLTLTVAPGTPAEASCAEGEAGEAALALRRSVWKDKLALPPPAVGRFAWTPPEADGELTVSVAASGTVKVAGKLLDGTRLSSSVTAYWDEKGVWRIAVPVPPTKVRGGLLLETELPFPAAE